MSTEIVRTLAQNIALVDMHLKSYRDAGNALRDIRDLEQYKPRFPTFEAFGKAQWGMAKSQAYRLIQAAAVADALSPIGGRIAPPENERQARAIADATDDKKTQQIIWTQAVETAPKDKAGRSRVTAAHVKKVAEKVVGKSGEREPGDEPPAPEHKPAPAAAVPAPAENPFDELIANVDWILNMVVPKVQTYAIDVQSVLNENDHLKRTADQLMGQVYKLFHPYRGRLANAQQNHRRAG